MKLPLWRYVPGSMRDEDGNPVAPTTGTIVSNPNTSGGGSGTATPPDPNGQIVNTGTSYCKSAVNVYDDGSGVATLYVFTTYIPC